MLQINKIKLKTGAAKAPVFNYKLVKMETSVNKGNGRLSNHLSSILELNGQRFIPMHYGAYRLADDTGSEALDRLQKEWERLKLNQYQLAVLKIGETIS